MNIMMMMVVMMIIMMNYKDVFVQLLRDYDDLTRNLGKRRHIFLQVNNFIFYVLLNVHFDTSV